MDSGAQSSDRISAEDQAYLQRVRAARQGGGDGAKAQNGAIPMTKRTGAAIIVHPQAYYTPELKRFTEEKIARIECPVFVAHGDQSGIDKINNEIVVPAFKAAGQQAEEILYPGANHGFSQRGTPEEMKKFFDDCNAFFKQPLPTQPTPLEGRAASLK